MPLRAALALLLAELELPPKQKTSAGEPIDWAGLVPLRDVPVGAAPDDAIR